MIYAAHHAKGAPVLGALLGQEGPTGRWPEPGQDDTDVDTEGLAPVAAVPAPDAVLDTAFHEFNLLLTAEQARTALREVRFGATRTVSAALNQA
ncbi:hypothetical protein [Streptomyces virginiae]|uniref:hypothetical protein n=1 Tax=Streptomyces virginiae TaxID=1961 RepID=UPI0032544528